MPFSGALFNLTDGVRTGRDVVQRYSASQVPKPNASDALVDAILNDLADGIGQLLLRNGRNSPSADMDWGGNKLVNLRPGAAAGEAVTFDQLGGGVLFVGAANVGGTANAITLSVDSSPAAYTAGAGYLFVAEHENTAAVTLKEGTKAAVAMRRSDGSAFEGGELAVGQLVEAVHDGTRFLTNVGLRRWFGTKAAYDALAVKRDGVLYFTRS